MSTTTLGMDALESALEENAAMEAAHEMTGSFESSPGGSTTEVGGHEPDMAEEAFAQGGFVAEDEDAANDDVDASLEALDDQALESELDEDLDEDLGASDADGGDDEDVVTIEQALNASKAGTLDVNIRRALEERAEARRMREDLDYLDMDD